MKEITAKDIEMSINNDEFLEIDAKSKTKNKVLLIIGKVPNQIWKEPVEKQKYQVPYFRNWDIISHFVRNKRHYIVLGKES